MRHLQADSHVHGRGIALGGEHHAEDYAARKHPEFVALELGAELGALIIHTDPDLHGVEVEISPGHDDAERSHKQVLERSARDRPAFTAVFDRLPAGRYALWVHGQAVAGGVTVAGGSITALDWRGAALPGRGAAGYDRVSPHVG